MSRTSPQEPPLVVLSGIIQGETAKAIRFEIHAIGEQELPEDKIKQAWFPLSQVPKTLRQSHISPDMNDCIWVKDWIWRAKLDELWDGIHPLSVRSREVKKPAQAPTHFSNEEDDDYNIPF